MVDEYSSQRRGEGLSLGGGVDAAKARFADSKVYICRLPVNGKYFGKIRRPQGGNKIVGAPCIVVSKAN